MKGPQELILTFLVVSAGFAVRPLGAAYPDCVSIQVQFGPHYVNKNPDSHSIFVGALGGREVACVENPPQLDKFYTEPRRWISIVTPGGMRGYILANNNVFLRGISATPDPAWEALSSKAAQKAIELLLNRPAGYSRDYYMALAEEQMADPCRAYRFAFSARSDFQLHERSRPFPDFIDFYTLDSVVKRTAGACLEKDPNPPGNVRGERPFKNMDGNQSISIAYPFLMKKDKFGIAGALLSAVSNLRGDLCD